jgi:hypothetical protein
MIYDAVWTGTNLTDYSFILHRNMLIKSRDNPIIRGKWI